VTAPPAPHPTSLDLETWLLAEVGEIAAVRCRWLLRLAELDARDEWRTLGARSGVHWLCLRLRVGRRTATEHLRVARALIGLPAIRARFNAGRISYSKVRAITRVATPATERELLNLAASCTSGQLERIVGGGGDGRAAKPARELTWRWEADGGLSLRLRLPADEGKRLITALERRTRVAGTEGETVPTTESADSAVEGPSTGTTARSAESIATRRAAALLELVAHRRVRRGPGRRPEERHPVQRRPARPGRAARAGAGRRAGRGAGHPLPRPRPVSPGVHPPAGGHIPPTDTVPVPRKTPEVPRPAPHGDPDGPASG
jgi:hypothetical protein